MLPFFTAKIMLLINTLYLIIIFIQITLCRKMRRLMKFINQKEQDSLETLWLQLSQLKLIWLFIFIYRYSLIIVIMMEKYQSFWTRKEAQWNAKLTLQSAQRVFFKTCWIFNVLTLKMQLTMFYSDVKALSKYSPLMLHLSPATRILSENPKNGKGMNCKLYYILWF